MGGCVSTTMIYKHNTIHITIFDGKLLAMLQLTGKESQGVIDDIILSPFDVENFLQGVENLDSKSKRAIRLNPNRNTLWNNGFGDKPIYYKIKSDSRYQDKHIKLLNRSLIEWMTKTCLRFVQIDENETQEEQHLMFQDSLWHTGCESYVGQQPKNWWFPQPVYLSKSTCFNVIGTLLHEIGHVLGLYHQHIRQDRDDYVTIHKDNIQEYSLSNFVIPAENLIDSKGVPYDLGSVEHYSTKAFGKRDTSVNPPDTYQTITPKDATLERVPGQRSEVSFYDAQVINRVYCSHICTGVALDCQNGGYVDPNNCTGCRCPDGFSGRLCEEIQSGSPGCNPLSGEIILDTEDEVCVHTPNYYDAKGNVGSYEEGENCTWRIKVPNNCSMKTYFEPRFALIPLLNGACLHWVEVRPGDNRRGRRFCGYNSPAHLQHTPLSLNVNSAFVLFRAYEHVEIFNSNSRKGFRMCFKIENSTCLSTKHSETTIEITTIPTSATITTSPNDTSTTTNTPTITNAHPTQINMSNNPSTTTNTQTTSTSTSITSTGTPMSTPTTITPTPKSTSINPSTLTTNAPTASSATNSPITKIFTPTTTASVPKSTSSNPSTIAETSTTLASTKTTSPKTLTPSTTSTSPSTTTLTPTSTTSPTTISTNPPTTTSNPTSTSTITSTYSPTTTSNPTSAPTITSTNSPTTTSTPTSIPTTTSTNPPTTTSTTFSTPTSSSSQVFTTTMTATTETTAVTSLSSAINTSTKRTAEITTPTTLPPWITPRYYRRYQTPRWRFRK